MKCFLAPRVLDRHWRIEWTGLGTDIVFPRDFATLRLESHDKAATGATAAEWASADSMLIGAAGDDDETIGQNRRRENTVR
jgi:hypothetical protein